MTTTYHPGEITHMLGTLENTNTALHWAAIITKHLGPTTLCVERPLPTNDNAAYQALTPEARAEVDTAVNRIKAHHLHTPGIQGVGMDLRTAHPSWDTLVDVTAENVADAQKRVLAKYAELEAAAAAR